MLRIKKLTRDLVIERDSSQCQICFKEATQIHHVTYKSHCGNNTPCNLICLCNSCHAAVHKNGKKWFKILFKLQQRHYTNLSKEDMKK